MGLGKIIGGLFGGSGKESGRKPDAAKEMGDPVEHNGFTIQAAPLEQGGHWLTAGFIRKPGADGETREHRFIRADTHSTADAAAEMAVEKGKRIIDEQGERLFDDGD